MIIEIVLIVLGLLTIALSIWNFIVGAYVWAGLFLIGGVWSVWLGTVYILQLRKLRKAEEARVKVEVSKKDLEEEFSSSIEPDETLIFESKIEDTEEAEESENKKEDSEIDKAVLFTDEVVPNPTVDTNELDTLNANLPVPVKIEDIDRNVEVIQDIADKNNN